MDRLRWAWGIFALTFAGILHATLTSGTSLSWTGAAAPDNSLGNNGNWSGSLTNDGSDTLIFGTGATVTSINVAASFSAYGLSFTGSSYTLTGTAGSSLSIGAGGITASAPTLLDSTLGLQLTSAQTWDVSSKLTVNGPITGSFAITKTGTGTLNLGGTNTFSGGLTVAGATLQAGSNTAAGSGMLTLNDGTTLSAVSSATGGITLSNSVTLAGNVTLNDTSATTSLQFDGLVSAVNATTTISLASSNAVYFHGNLDSQTPGGSVVFNGSGSGTAVLEGSGTNLNEIDASDTAVIFFTTGALPSNRIQASLGGYVGMADGFSSTGSASPAVLLAKLTDPTHFAGTIGFDTYPGAAVNAFTGTIDLTNFTGTNFTGLGTITSAILDGNAVIKPPSGGVLQLSGLGSGTLTVSSPLLSANGITSVIVGDGTSTQFTGSLVLTNSGNNYTGGTQIQSGTLYVANGTAMGTGTISTPSNSYYPRLAASASGLTLTNSFNLGGPGLVVGVDGAGNGLTLTGPIAGAGILGIHDTTTLSGANTVAGIIVDKGAGLAVATDSPASATGTFNVQWGSVTFTAAAATPIIGTLSGTSSGSITLAAASGATLTINQISDAHYSGTINQGSVDFAGSLVKTGGANLYLDNSNHYAGFTTISGGALIADNANALGSSTALLDGGGLGVASGVTLTNAITFGTNGGKLGGAGTFAPASGLVIGTNIALYPKATAANGPAKLSFGTSGLTLASGGAIRWLIQSVGTSQATDAGSLFGTIVVNGPVSIGATAGSPFTVLPISLNSDANAGPVGDFNASTPYSWLLLSASGGITNFNAGDFSFDTTSFTNALAGGAFSLSLGGDNTELFLNFTPVPEPSEDLLLASGLGIVLLAAWRRRRSRAPAHGQTYT